MWPFLTATGDVPPALTDDLLGARSGVAVRAWEPRDAVAYAVGIGAGPQEGMPFARVTVLCQHGVEFPTALGPWPADGVEHVEHSHRLLPPLAHPDARRAVVPAGLCIYGSAGRGGGVGAARGTASLG